MALLQNRRQILSFLFSSFLPLVFSHTTRATCAIHSFSPLSAPDARDPSPKEMEKTPQTGHLTNVGTNAL